MVDHVVVGCAQLKLRLSQSLSELDDTLMRFVRLAQTKRVRLLVFPQYTGLMTAALVTRDTRSGLLKQADQARHGRASIWKRATAKLAGGAAGVLRADFGQALENALARQSAALWENYVGVFSDLARRHAMTIVAGSTYLVDPADHQVRHLALVFGPNGELLGQQPAVSLLDQERSVVQPGQQWQPIQTPVGRIGILLGNDMLYPEPGRLLAYAGVDILLGLGASTTQVHAQRQRQGLLARVEENQVYGAMSFVVGYNPFTPGEETPFQGRSLLAAPMSTTPRYSGVLVEVGTDSTEGLITAEWSYTALRELWVTDPAPVRSSMPVKTMGGTLAAIYGRELTIDEATRIGLLEGMVPGLPEPEAEVYEAEFEAEAEALEEEPEAELEGEPEAELVLEAEALEREPQAEVDLEAEPSEEAEMAEAAMAGAAEEPEIAVEDAGSAQPEAPEEEQQK